MPELQPSCFVVMGFGEKTDYRTSRVLDLDKTYRHIIKKAAEAAGLRCVRADEIPHAGTIDVPMYEQLLQADVVIADLSTANLNAAYELGIRHALKPATTVIIAEEQFTSPFDINHLVIRRYRHDGRALDIDEVDRFRTELAEALRQILAGRSTDSPVYTFLPTLQPPCLQQAAAAAAAAAIATGHQPGALEADGADGADAPPALAELLAQLRQARDDGRWDDALALIEEARERAPGQRSYLIQQQALVTVRACEPDEPCALRRAREILTELKPMGCNNTDTLLLWGTLHQRLYELQDDPADLDTAWLAFEKTWRLLADPEHGARVAWLLNLRAARPGAAADEAVADFVLARRTRRALLARCEQALAELDERARRTEAGGTGAGSAELRLRRRRLHQLAAEACVGLGDEDGAAAHGAQALVNGAPDPALARRQAQLRAWLQATPLARCQPPAAGAG